MIIGEELESKQKWTEFWLVIDVDGFLFWILIIGDDNFNKQKTSKHSLELIGVGHRTNVRVGLQ